MRELASREYTPILAYAAGALFLAHFLVLTLLRDPVAAAGVHLLFVPALVLVVMRADAAPWARLCGYAWGALALLGDVLTLATAASPGATLGALALLPGAAWVVGASMEDAGYGRALGGVAAAGLAFSGALGLTRELLLVGSWDLGALLQQLTLVACIVWFVVLGRDLARGERHWGGHVGGAHPGPSIR